MNYYKQFMLWRKDNVPKGDVYLRLFGDDGMVVVEVRESSKRFLVTMYSMHPHRSSHRKIAQNRYHTIDQAMRRAYEVEEAF